jgi:hypothetical protein
MFGFARGRDESDCRLSAKAPKPWDLSAALRGCSMTAAGKHYAEQVDLVRAA